MQNAAIQIRFPTHNAHILVKNNVIRVFKYNGQCCDYDVFHDEYTAADYLVEPLSDVHWRVAVDNEI